MLARAVTHKVNLQCIGIFIRSIKITNEFLFLNIHFHDLFSCSLKGLGRGRLHYLLAGDEGLVTRAKEALEDDVEGDSGPWRICFQSSLQNQDTQLKNFNINEIVLRLNTGLRGGQYVQEILQSLVFLRLFKHEETPFSSTKCLNMSETSLQFTKSFRLTSSLGESW